LELCPTSNLQTRAIAAIADHPIERFRAEGVPVTLSTDARTVSQVTLESEYELMQKEFGWTPDVWNEAQVAASNAAFVGTQQREQILARLKV
jgi:adenosine deaminase